MGRAVSGCLIHGSLQRGHIGSRSSKTFQGQGFQMVAERGYKGSQGFKVKVCFKVKVDLKVKFLNLKSVCIFIC